MLGRRQRGLSCTKLGSLKFFRTKQAFISTCSTVGVEAKKIIVKPLPQSCKYQCISAMIKFTSSNRLMCFC